MSSVSVVEAEWIELCFCGGGLVESALFLCGGLVESALSVVEAWWNQLCFCGGGLVE
jgi:hypothetical protein